MSFLGKGDLAPEFSLPAQDGTIVSLADLKGRKVVVFFYPKAMTSGCTRQVLSVQEEKDDLAASGIIALGISPDPIERQRKFSEKHGIGYQLLSDTDHSVAKLYGAWGRKTVYGKKSEGIIRSVFLINGDGRIMRSWYKIKPEDTIPRIKEALTMG